MRHGISRLVFGFGSLLAVTPAVAAAELSTVDSYTPAQEHKAQDEAKAAGYQPTLTTMVQDGNFFLNATRDGRSYALTVTRDGKVFASGPA